jgi:hypothetical protein
MYATIGFASKMSESVFCSFIMLQGYSVKRRMAFKLLIFAGVAQLVEQLICNQQVAGSSPVASSKKNIDPFK